MPLLIDLVEWRMLRKSAARTGLDLCVGNLALASTKPKNVVSVEWLRL